MRAIIGPNGAGKTTMMDVITGKTRPDEGDVLFDGNVDLTKLDEADIAELGIGRKFQKPTVFESHTVDDNLAAGARRRPRVALPRCSAARHADERERIDAVLGPSGLADHARPHGRPTHARPEAVAGDRHAAGAGPEAAAGRRAGGRHDRRRDRGDGRAAARIASDHSVVVVEHDMDFVRALGCKVTCCTRARCWPRARSTPCRPNDRVVVTQ